MSLRPCRSAVFYLVLAAACGGHAEQASSQTPKPEKYPVAEPLATEAIAGQKVCVLPLTLMVPVEALAEQAPYNDRTRILTMADSIIGVELEARAPSVDWVLPDQLRQKAKQAQGLVVSPDKLGQSVLRSTHLKDLPDPLWSNLRTLSALAGSELAFVPAMLEYFTTPDGRIRAQLTLAAANTRTGKIAWRTVATGLGGTPERALTDAMNTVLVLSQE